MSGSVLLDETGLHSLDCECLRCETGFRPTPAARWHARDTLARRLAAEMPRKETASERRRREDRERCQRESLAAQRQLEADLAAYRPPTPEQLAELRAEYPNLHGRHNR